jgi:7-cyano-7-deazaguanine synthase
LDSDESNGAGECNMSIITLVSGGMDSTLMSLLIKEQCIEQFPLFINYGQICVEAEWKTCKKLFKKYKLPNPTKLNICGYGKLFESGITSKKKRIFEDAFLPGRNALFILCASAFAYQKNCNTLAIGLLNDKQHIFNDQTKKFICEIEKLLSFILDRKIYIITPLMKFSKSDIIQMLKKKKILGTYSCHSGTRKPCGKCVSCLEIINSSVGG